MNFDELVAAGLPLLDGMDDSRWALGDLAADYDFPAGRPTNDDEPKLSDLADAWNVSPQSVSEWRTTAAFYPANLRTFVGLRWSHYNQARRAAGDDPEKALDNALELLSDAVTLHLGVNRFGQYIRGELWAGDVAYDELPARLKTITPPGSVVWGVFKRKVNE